ncbi:MAG: ATP-binding protein [Victivallaceae bacterium]|nr:ATP-binding protein [Victivallaceae bacterium]
MSVRTHKKTSRKSKGFKSNFDYLENYFDLLYEQVSLYAVKNMDVILKGNSITQDNAKDFYLKLGLKNKQCIPEKITAMTQAYNDSQYTFQARVKASKITLHLESLAFTHQLIEFEKNAIALALAVATDPRFNILGENLDFNNIYKNWTIKDYLNILTGSFKERVNFRRYFMATGKLNSKGLILLEYDGGSVGTENNFLEMSVQLPRRISSAIYGEDEPEDMILAFSEIITPTLSIDNVVLDEELKREVSDLVEKRELFMKRRIEWGIDKVLSYGMGTIMLFSGSPGTGKTMLAHALAKHANLKLLQVTVPNLLNVFVSFEENFRLLLREAKLQNAILFFDEADELFADRCINQHMPTILREFERFDGIAILATNRKQILDEAMDRRILYKLDFGLPSPEMREKIWREHLPPQLPMADDVNLTELAEKYEFAGGYIKNAVLLATQKAVARTGNKAKVFHADLRWAASRQRDSQLERFADKVTPKVKMAEIIVPPTLKSRLDNIINEYRNTNKVYEQWAFKSTIHHGKAITALFHGEPGVGKTMAAEAMASELGLNLYPVKISAIVSCYVGETAKNLKNIFAAARDAEAVLLFDEADALFSARIEGGSYHAVYLNQQVDTLLQEIERFDGIVILTSNMPERLDKAFSRRIRHHLNFPFPSSSAREQIWQHHFPKSAPLAKDIDFAALGKDYELSGGIIRNLAIKAAFAAAGNQAKLITMDLLEELITAELDTQTRKPKNLGFGNVA